MGGGSRAARGLQLLSAGWREGWLAGFPGARGRPAGSCQRLLSKARLRLPGPVRGCRDGSPEAGAGGRRPRPASNRLRLLLLHSHSACLQGTVLIKSAEELEGYSRSEEDRIEELIKGIAGGCGWAGREGALGGAGAG